MLSPPKSSLGLGVLSVAAVGGGAIAGALLASAAMPDNTPAAARVGFVTTGGMLGILATGFAGLMVFSRGGRWADAGEAVSIVGVGIVLSSGLYEEAKALGALASQVPLGPSPAAAPLALPAVAATPTAAAAATPAQVPA